MKFKKEFTRLVAENGIVAGPISLSLISIVENQLNVQFPKQYVEILEKYGSILLDGKEIYGVVKDTNEPPLFQTVLNETIMRRENNSFFKDNPQYIPISNNSYGKIFFLDTSISPNLKIKSYDHGIEKNEYDDVYEFILTYDC